MGTTLQQTCLVYQHGGHIPILARCIKWMVGRDASISGTSKIKSLAEFEWPCACRSRNELKLVGTDLHHHPNYNRLYFEIEGLHTNSETIHLLPQLNSSSDVGPDMKFREVSRIAGLAANFLDERHRSRVIHGGVT